MSRTNTILKNMQPLLNYLVLIAPAIPTVSNSWIPLNPRLLVFVIVVSPTSSTILPNHGALRAICDYSAADDLVGFHVAHPVVLPSCHPPLPRTIYWASCRVNNCWWKWRRREGATELWKSSEVHLNLFPNPNSGMNWIHSRRYFHSLFWKQWREVEFLLKHTSHLSIEHFVTKQMKVRALQGIRVIWPSSF